MKNKYKKTGLENFVAGLTLASLFYLIAFQFIDLGLDRNGIFVTTALMAITGTLTAAWIALKTNSNSDKKRRIAKLKAEKAVLPLALSNICNVCLANMKMHNPAYHTNNAVYEEIETTTINTIKACIEFADGYSQKHLANIIKTYQVLLSRGRGVKIISLTKFIPMVISTPEDLQANRTVMNWAVLYALSSQALGYSRDEVEIIPQGSIDQDVQAVFQFSEIFLDFNPELQDLFDQKLKNDSFEIF